MSVLSAKIITEDLGGHDKGVEHVFVQCVEIPIRLYWIRSSAETRSEFGHRLNSRNIGVFQDRSVGMAST